MYYLDELELLFCASVPCVLFLVIVLIIVQADWPAVRRLLRQRRFGMSVIFSVTAVVAVDLALMRLLKVRFDEPAAIVIGGILVVFAVFIVGFVGLVIDEFTDRGRTQLRRKKFRDDEEADDEHS